MEWYYLLLYLSLSIPEMKRNKEKPIYIWKYFRLLLLLLPETINKKKCFAVIIIDGGIFSLLKIDFLLSIWAAISSSSSSSCLSIDDWRSSSCLTSSVDDDDQAKSIYPQHFWWFEYCGGGQTPIFFDN